MQFVNLSLALPKERDAPAVLEWIRALDILIDSLGTFKFTPGEEAVSSGVLETGVGKVLLWDKMPLRGAGFHSTICEASNGLLLLPRPRRAKQAGGRESVEEGGQGAEGSRAEAPGRAGSPPREEGQGRGGAWLLGGVGWGPCIRSRRAPARATVFLRAAPARPDSVG